LSVLTIGKTVEETSFALDSEINIFDVTHNGKYFALFNK